MRRILLFVALLCGVTAIEAKVSLPSLLASGAVLQQCDRVTLWGGAEPNRKVSIQPSWTKQAYATTSSSDGEWEIEVETPTAGGPYTITFDDGTKDITTIESVMLGEVWLCFGQSNMRMPMKGYVGQPVEGAMDTIMQADSLAPLRYYQAKNIYSFKPKEHLAGEWMANSPRYAPSFGATPYHFGLYLQRVLGVPVGIVECAWGGSNIEAWMSEDMLKRFNPQYKIPVDNGGKVKSAQQRATLLYNGILEPMKRLKFKGAIWYQGEANAARYGEYASLFKIFVESLRSDHFDCGTFPFYYAQIAPYERANFVMMREVQQKLTSQVERTGMVVLSDVGERNIIHPRHKREVGERFAYMALGDTYGYNSVAYSAPEYVSMRELAANKLYPKRVALTFKNAPQGLCFGDPESPSINFEVAGEDRLFYPAEVLIGKGKNHLEVWSDKVDDIVAVRYGFHNYFKGDVYNAYGIPLSSFRTDSWEIE